MTNAPSSSQVEQDLRELYGDDKVQKVLDAINFILKSGRAMVESVVNAAEEKARELNIGEEGVNDIRRLARRLFERNAPNNSGPTSSKSSPVKWIGGSEF